MTNKPNHFSWLEKDLDTHFLGQLIVHNVDDYGSIKAGTTSKVATVRSKVNFETGYITFVSLLSSRYGVTDIIMDGSVGLYGKITEKIIQKGDEKTSVDLFYLKHIQSDKISKNYYITSDGYKVWEGLCEMDDVVFNGGGVYGYPVFYYGTNTNCSKLVGITIEIPIKHMNYYIHMRNLWYLDYKGCKDLIE